MKTVLETLISLDEETEFKKLDESLLNEDVDSLLIFLKTVGILLGFAGLSVALPRISEVLNRYIDAGFGAIKKFLLRKEIDRSEETIRRDAESLKDHHSKVSLADLAAELERNKQLVRMMNDFIRADKKGKMIISRQMLSYTQKLTNMGDEVLGFVLGDMLDKYIHKNDVFNRY